MNALEALEACYAILNQLTPQERSLVTEDLYWRYNDMMTLEDDE